MSEVQVFPDIEALAWTAAEHIVALAEDAVAVHGRFSLVLSGGSTPRTLYALLATGEFAPRIDWEYVHIFWGDERCVPPDHADSNYRMAREALLDHVPLPEGNIHRIRGEVDPVQAATEYEHTLRAFFKPQADEPPQPRFDVLLLGMGDDGHTASLFPGTAALHNTARWVVANYVEKLGAWRITLTPAAINAAANVWFLVAGSGKAATLRAALHGPYQPDTYPSQLVQPDPGRLLWLVDESAAALL